MGPVYLNQEFINQTALFFMLPIMVSTLLFPVYVSVFFAHKIHLQLKQKLFPLLLAVLFIIFYMYTETFFGIFGYIPKKYGFLSFLILYGYSLYFYIKHFYKRESFFKNDLKMFFSKHRYFFKLFICYAVISLPIFLIDPTPLFYSMLCWFVFLSTAFLAGPWAYLLKKLVTKIKSKENSGVKKIIRYIALFMVLVLVTSLMYSAIILGQLAIAGPFGGPHTH